MQVKIWFWSINRIYDDIRVLLDITNDEIVDANLIMTVGIFTKKTHYTKIRHITDIEIKQNMVERLFGYGDIVIKDGSKSLDGSIIRLYNVMQPDVVAKNILVIKEKLNKGNLFVESL